MTDDELRGLTDDFAGDRIAGMIVRAFDLAARTHPGQLRTALALVYDQSAVEAYTRQASALAQAAAQVVVDLAADIRNLKELLNQVGNDAEKRMDNVNMRLDKAARAFDQLARLYAALAKDRVNRRPPTTARTK